MPDSNKPRLYVAVYPTPGYTTDKPKFHWALMVGPKQEKSSKDTPGIRFHVKNTQTADGAWQYEEQPLMNVKSTSNLLARILIAKVEDQQRLISVLRSVPIIQGDDNWRCRHWVINAVAALEVDGKAIGTSVLQWDRIQQTAETFVVGKIAAGRYSDMERGAGPRPLFDMLSGQEVVP